MKILFIQDSLGTGGAERSNAELWYYLREMGVEIEIVVLEHRKEGIEKEILNAGFKVNFLGPGSFFNHVKQIQKIIGQFQPNIVHSVLFKAAMRTRFAKLLVKFKHVESLVNSTYAEIRYKDPKVNSRTLKFYEKIDRVSQQFGVDHFIAITHQVAKHYQKHLKFRKDKVSVIYRGRKENSYLKRREELRSSLLEKLELGGKGPIFIHVGRQEFQKAHLDILRAIKLIDENLVAQEAIFLFCGRKGNASEEIEDFLKENTIKTTIRFLGHRNDIYELLAASDIFVFPSLFEGLGGSLIEAQAAGLPIICSDIAVFKEVVTEENALIHKVNDSVSLSTKLVEIINADREKMSRMSLLNYRNNFKLEMVNKSMFNLYRRILSESQLE